ncbi:MAG: DUF4157 domain-containing protein, partial [Actinomycetota bacterium]|nr:DUF4157 domain-containing protein [Actinomycetota bacterium]
PKGPGAPLPGGTRSALERSFGRDLSSLRVHDSSDAVHAAGAAAAAHGSNVFFAPGQYRPGSVPGLWLLAHETAHVVQQQAPGESAPDAASEEAASRAAADVVRGRPASAGPPVAEALQTFVGSEHRDLGQEGTGGTTRSDVNVGTDAAPDFLTFGEVVMLAGDYFETVDELRATARDPLTRPQVAWARWWALNPRGGPGEPAVSDATKQAVRERYFRLAAANVSHFSVGGTARNEYERVHHRALVAAFQAGVTRRTSKWDEALTTEAFADHYLTDMFSAGHVRTPRADLRTWYTAHHPNSTRAFVRFMATRMNAFLAAAHPYANFFGQVPSVAALEQLIQSVGGPAIGAFSLGDIVSLAIHNRDSQGLDVVSDVDPSGSPPLVYPEHGGARAQGPPALGVHHWRAAGDERLVTSPETRQMAVAAVRASFEDLNVMRAAGAAASASAVMSTPETAAGLEEAYRRALESLGPSPSVPYRAEAFIPRVDPGSAPFTLNWEWGSFDATMRRAVDDAVKGDVARELRSIASARTNADERDALNDFAALLENEGIRALERAIGAPAGP